MSTDFPSAREAWQIVDTVSRVEDPAVLADMAGYAPYLSNDRKRELLETPDVTARLALVSEWAREHLAELEVSEKIRDDVREGMDKRQREFLLREQLAAMSVPTLVITGDEDEPCLDPGLMLKRTVPTARLAVLPGTGHALNLEEPALFNRLVGDFWHLVESGRYAARDPRSVSASVIGEKS